MTVSLTVLGREACPDTAALRDALDAAWLPYRYILLGDASDTVRAACGYTAPAVLVRGAHGGLQTHVRPDPSHVARLTRDLGVLPQAP